MDLVFNEKDGGWEVEFEATGNFSLRVTKEGEGDVSLYQRSVAEGDYDFTARLNRSSRDRVIDRQIVGAVFPVWIRVRSSVKPTTGVVTFA
jgi:hypothetical protein